MCPYNITRNPKVWNEEPKSVERGNQKCGNGLWDKAKKASRNAALEHFWETLNLTNSVLIAY